MFLQNLRAKVGARLNGDREAGFTLIELLVVMLILGILAAIALPAFFNQKDKAGDAKAKEYAHSAQVAMETYFTDNGTYAGATETALEAIEPSLKNATFSAVTPNGTTGYTITIQGAKTTQKFSVVNTNGTLTYPCETAGQGGCPNGSPAEWD
ncbi:MAG: type II secretion system GspH family protein [Actinomycetota bacterium]|nr:type II secretion system GspH family protein [Actinomycetota bacterium]